MAMEAAMAMGKRMGGVGDGDGDGGGGGGDGVGTWRRWEPYICCKLQTSALSLYLKFIHSSPLMPLYRNTQSSLTHIMLVMVMGIIK